MRTGVLALLFLAGAGVARADKPPAVGGDYDVTLAQVSNTCANGGIRIEKGTLTIEQKGRASKIKVLLPPTAIMRGSIDGAAKVKARARRGGTAIIGLLGEYTVSGTINAGKVDMVLVGQYFANGRAYCQQSWNIKGTKK